MDNVNLLSNISNNFTKLFKECQNGNTFLPPVFNTSSDIDTLIVLHQVLYILCNRRISPTPENIILYQTVVEIINIKCKEYVQQSSSWNKNEESFMSTFETYINGMIENIFNLTTQRIL
jgi:hypothetical protein